jgi:hypothetical protein
MGWISTQVTRLTSSIRIKLKRKYQGFYPELTSQIKCMNYEHVYLILEFY